MSDDITIPIAAIAGVGGGGGILSVLAAWVLRSHDKRLEKIEADNADVAAVAAAVEKNLSAYQLDSEKRFAKEESVQASLARLHQRIDETATKDDLKDLKVDVGGLRDDIKVLIGKTAASII